LVIHFCMDYFIAYLDEFGHIGPYISRNDKKYQESPIFGLGGFIIPANKARQFGTWFYQRKNDLLAWEVARSGLHPAVYEKKGSALYTTRNIENYPELTHFTGRMFKAIERFGGNTFYVGIHKEKNAQKHSADDLYMGVIREAIKRLNQHAREHNSCFQIILDQHASREKILTTASIAMFRDASSNRLIEPPYQVESHRYQTVQAADWICGLLGRLGAYWAEPEEWPDMIWAKERFQDIVTGSQIRSGIRT
jgi:ribonucleotide reductase alpha subunit